MSKFIKKNICALCDVALTFENKSKEHIIPNALGGRKTANNFICKNCNDKTGLLWDADIAMQHHDWSLMACIRRHHGEVPPKKYTTSLGQELLLKSDGQFTLAQPIFEETTDGKILSVSIQARTMGEAKKMLKGLSKKYPDTDMSNALAGVTEKVVPKRQTIQRNTSFGGDIAHRSSLKSVLALIADNATTDIELSVLPKNLFQEEKLNCFALFYEKDLVVNRPQNFLIHCVSVFGNSETGLILGYVEYFSFHRVLILLSNNFAGENFQYTYAIDPTLGVEIQLDLDTGLSREEINSLYLNNPVCMETVRNVTIDAHTIASDIFHERELEKVISQAVDSASKRIGITENTPLSNEQINELIISVMAEVEPYMKLLNQTHSS